MYRCMYVYKNVYIYCIYTHTHAHTHTRTHTHISREIYTVVRGNIHSTMKTHKSVVRGFCLFYTLRGGADEVKVGVT